MSWISVHDGVDGPKLREFSRMAGCSKAEALGILLKIWLTATKPGNVSSAGLLNKFTLSDIEDVFRCDISETLDVRQVSKALIDSGWIDEVGGEYFIHDWEDAQEPLSKYQREKEGAAKRKRRERAMKRGKGVETAAPQEEHPPEESALEPAPPTETPPPDEKMSSPAESTKGQKRAVCSKAFEMWWEVYPRKVGKGEAYKKYCARKNDGFSDEELLEAAKAYSSECQRNHTEPKYIKHPKTFLSENTPFADYIPKKALTPQSGADEIEEMMLEWSRESDELWRRS